MCSCLSIGSIHCVVGAAATMCVTQAGVLGFVIHHGKQQLATCAALKKLITTLMMKTTTVLQKFSKIRTGVYSTCASLEPSNSLRRLKYVTVELPTENNVYRHIRYACHTFYVSVANQSITMCKIFVAALTLFGSLHV